MNHGLMTGWNVQVCAHMCLRGGPRMKGGVYMWEIAPNGAFL